MNKKMDKKTIKKGLLPYLFIFVIMLGVFYFYTVAGQKVNDLTYDKFIEKLNKEEITELTIVTRGSGYVYAELNTLLPDNRPYVDLLRSAAHRSLCPYHYG